MKTIRFLLMTATAGVFCMTFAADKGWKLPAETARLEKGPGVEIAAGQCMICHSVDYISTQPRMTRAAWTATVVKMREKYGAPLQTNDVERLVDYLAKTYGSEKSAPPQK